MSSQGNCNTTSLNDVSLDARMLAVGATTPGFIEFNQFMLIFSLLLVASFLFMWFALKNRFERTRVRPSVLVLMTAAGTTLCILVDHLPVAGGFLYPCALLALFLAYIVPLIAGAIASRMVMFYFLSVFSQEVAASALSKMSDTGFAYDLLDEGDDPVASIFSSFVTTTRLILRMVFWFPVKAESTNLDRIKMLKALRFVTSKWGAFSVVSFLIAPSMIVILVVILINFSLPECSRCTFLTSAILYTIISMGLFTVFIGLIMWTRVKSLPDPWGLRSECVYQLITSLIALVWFALELFLPDVATYSYYAFVHLLTASLVLVVAVSTVLQLWLGFKQTRARRKGSSLSSTGSIGLDEILSNPVSAEAFEKHLVSELGIESLLFVRDAESWKKTYFDIAPNARKSRAKKMHATYIAPSGLYAINIPDFMMREIAEKLDTEEEDVDQTLFDPALKEIKHLLQVGAVARFLDSPENRKQMTSARNKSIVTMQDLAHGL